MKINLGIIASEDGYLARVMRPATAGKRKRKALRVRRYCQG
jgi:hypothetical protein